MFSKYYFFLSCILQSYGVSDKATQSKDTTQSLYEASLVAAETVRTELEPELASAKNDVEQVSQKTKVTKQAVEAITK